MIWPAVAIKRTIPLVCAAFALTPAVALAADLEVGQAAPDFSLPDQDGKVHRLADYRGKNVILAFYPKDMTAG
jgi:peroxiredoxin Q/BCP